MTKFILNKILEQDSFFITDLKLSQIRLINNADYPWLILVPRQNDIVEITDLTENDYMTFCYEVREVSNIMQDVFKPNKLNIATIGNKVRQMHMHIIARYENDKAFPKPVWGDQFLQYEASKKDELMTNLKMQFGNI